jgi:asparagine synthase (glutamine-hydrolysing)
MCGILSIVNNKVNTGSEHLISACSIIKHRGPDDEGFLTWVPGGKPKIWAGGGTAASTRHHWHYDQLAPGQPFKVGFGHRRLSILDLSPAGHQPMVYESAGLALTFNGEVYNYLEIRAELQQLGHEFKTQTDTEVILHAWAQWGPECLDRFNGMFAIVILDYNKNELFAVRDRFGVKPLFYYQGTEALYLASEIKQIRTAPGYKFSLNEVTARRFLATGAVDNTDQTFDTLVKHLPGGHYLHVDLSKDASGFEIKRWYTFTPKKFTGSFDAAADKLRELLIDAVNLRLRSDVTVGSCLSGGLDSSSIVCIAADLLKARGDYAGQETVTACYENARYDEWNFAQEVIKKTNAHAHQTFPSFKQLQDEIDIFLWHQDEPTGSTSQFSQWAVFKATHDAGLKVMIDGQGADEQLAGYGGNDTAHYTGMMKNLQLLSLLDEAKSYKKENGSWPVGFVLNALQLSMGKGFTNALPKKYRIKRGTIDWLSGTEPSGIYDSPAHSLKDNLLRQLYGEPLPALLRYEDHSSMAWSIESRTPFLDYRFVEFTMGLPARYVYKNGVRKTVLRKAMHNVIPAVIESRRDKMGFVTPEEMWLKGEGKEWFLQGVEHTLKLVPSLFDQDKVRKLCADMISGAIPFDFTIWRILSFGKWYASVTNAA